eukprot:g31854.t1
MQLHGPAKSLQLAKMSYENKVTRQEIKHLAVQVSQLLVHFKLDVQPLRATHREPRAPSLSSQKKKKEGSEKAAARVCSTMTSTGLSFSNVLRITDDSSRLSQCLREALKGNLVPLVLAEEGAKQHAMEALLAAGVMTEPSAQCVSLRLAALEQRRQRDARRSGSCREATRGAGVQRGRPGESVRVPPTGFGWSPDTTSRLPDCLRFTVRFFTDALTSSIRSGSCFTLVFEDDGHAEDEEGWLQRTPQTSSMEVLPDEWSLSRFFSSSALPPEIFAPMIFNARGKAPLLLPDGSDNGVPPESAEELQTPAPTHLEAPTPQDLMLRAAGELPESSCGLTGHVFEASEEELQQRDPTETSSLLGLPLHYQVHPVLLAQAPMPSAMEDAEVRKWVKQRFGKHHWHVYLAPGGMAARERSSTAVEELPRHKRKPIVERFRQSSRTLHCMDAKTDLTLMYDTLEWDEAFVKDGLPNMPLRAETSKEIAPWTEVAKWSWESFGSFPLIELRELNSRQETGTEPLRRRASMPAHAQAGPPVGGAKPRGSLGVTSSAQPRQPAPMPPAQTRLSSTAAAETPPQPQVADGGPLSRESTSTSQRMSIPAVRAPGSFVVYPGVHVATPAPPGAPGAPFAPRATLPPGAAGLPSPAPPRAPPTSPVPPGSPAPGGATPAPVATLPSAAAQAERAQQVLAQAAQVVQQCRQSLTASRPTLFGAPPQPAQPGAANACYATPFVAMPQSMPGSPPWHPRPAASTEVSVPSPSALPVGAVPTGSVASEAPTALRAPTAPMAPPGPVAQLFPLRPRASTEVAAPSLSVSGAAPVGSAASAEARAPLAPTAAPMAAPLAAPLAAPRAQMTVSASQLLPGSPQPPSTITGAMLRSASHPPMSGPLLASPPPSHTEPQGRESPEGENDLFLWQEARATSFGLDHELLTPYEFLEARRPRPHGQRPPVRRQARGPASKR